MQTQPGDFPIMKRFTRMLLTIMIFSSIQVSCKHPPKKISLTATQNLMRSGGDENGTEVPFPAEVSLSSFRQNIYEPLLKPYCRSCHSETFVSDPIAVAHSNFLTRMELNKFSNTSETLLVDKLRHNHNCWLDTGAKCASAMSDAIDLWLADLLKAGYKPSPELFAIQTAEIPFFGGQAIDIPIDDQQYAAASVEQAVLKTPFIKLPLTKEGRIKSYAVGQGGSSLDEEASILFADPSQTITFELDVKTSGSYSVYARVNTPKSDMNGFFISVNDQTLDFPTPITGEDSWKWVQLTETLDDDTTQPVLVVVETPGKVQIPVIFKANGAKISYLVLNRKADEFNGEQFIVPYREIRVPLPVADSFLIATVWEPISAGKDKTYVGVRDLRIESPRPLHVKGIHPLINGVYYRNHGAYLLVDTVAGGSRERDKQLIQTGGSLSTTWIADLAVDRLSFAFDALEVSP